MDLCALQYSLQPPVTVASNWRDLMKVRETHIGIRQVYVQPHDQYAVKRMQRIGPVIQDPVPTKRSRHGIAIGHRCEQGGFINRHNSSSSGTQGHTSIPPAILAVLGDAPAMRERPTARKRLVDLSYEEYLDVCGRIEEEWHRRQLKQAYINSEISKKRAAQVR